MSTKFQFSSEEDDKLLKCVASYNVLYDTSNKDYKNYAIKENVWRDVSDKLGRTPTDCKKRWRNIRDTFMKIKRGHKYETGSAAKPKSKWPLLDQLSFLNNVYFKRSTYSKIEHNMESQEAMTSIESIGTSMDIPIDTSSIDTLPVDVHSIVSSGTSSIDTSSSDILSINTETNKRSLGAGNKQTKRHKNDKDKTLDFRQSRALGGEKLVQPLNRTISEDNDPILTFFRSMALMVKTFSPNLIAEAKYRVFNIIYELELKSIRENSLSNKSNNTFHNLTKL